MLGGFSREHTTDKGVTRKVQLVRVSVQSRKNTRQSLGVVLTIQKECFWLLLVESTVKSWNYDGEKISSNLAPRFLDDETTPI